MVRTHHSTYQNKVRMKIQAATHSSVTKRGDPSDSLAVEYDSSCGMRVIAYLLSGKSENQKKERGMVAMSILVKLQTIYLLLMRQNAGKTRIRAYPGCFHAHSVMVYMTQNDPR